MLKRVQPKEDVQVARSEFSSFLKGKLPAAGSFTDEQRETLFREFLQWREKQPATAQR
jgi:hypothetical protein